MDIRNRLSFIFTSERIHLLLSCGIFAVIFYTFTIPNLPSLWLQIAVCVYSLSLTMLIICYCFCCFLPLKPSESPSTSGKFCVQCQIEVSECTKHCEVCGMCVSGFRLHSSWLDRCIGTENCNWYLGLLLDLAVASGLQTTAGAWVSVLIFLRGEKGMEILQVATRQKYSLMDSGYTFQIGLLFVSAISFAVCIATCSLLLTFIRATVRLANQKLHSRRPSSRLDFSTTILRGKSQYSLRSHRMVVQTPHTPFHAIPVYSFGQAMELSPKVAPNEEATFEEGRDSRKQEEP